MGAVNNTVVHVSPRVQSFGGIESLQALHRGLSGNQIFVGLFDRDPALQVGCINLNFTWRTSLRRMRAEFRRALAPYAGSLVVYHNGWGLPLFSELDGASRRVVMLHADPSYHALSLAAFQGRIDGAIAITPATQRAVVKALPNLAGLRAQGFRVPIEFPPKGSRQIRPRGPLVLGWAGRVERAQKRLDRLPAFLAALRARGVDYRFEVIGNGSYRRTLARRVDDRVRFHGWVPREEYWRILAGWDAMVFFSDHEGGPIALLEGMAAGLVPFHPAIGGSWADIHGPAVDPRCAYSPGDMPGLARGVTEMFAESPEQIACWRERARELVAGHTAENYLHEFQTFLSAIRTEPSISEPIRRRGCWQDWLPLGAVSRVFPGRLHSD
jgi:glycosyltransferase involved in cell wall biosynthesis